MNKYTQKVGAAFFSATMLLASAPAVAHADSLGNSTGSVGAQQATGISQYAEQHAQELGKAIGMEQNHANGTFSQEFEHGLVTYSPRTGAKALTNPAEIEAFKAAGGAEKFGALESSSWNSSFCGQSVTTYDGATRWMVVVDETTQPASSIDLNSPEAVNWRYVRFNNPSCFADNAPDPVTGEQSAPQTEFTVEEALKLESDAMWGSSDGYWANPTGNLTELGDRFLVETNIGLQTFVYDKETGKSAWMDYRVYNEFVKDTSQFGDIAYSVGVGGGKGGPEANYTITYFTAEDGSEVQATGVRESSVWVYPDNGDDYVIDNETRAAEIDPTQIDWSKATYLPLHHALMYMSGDTVWVITANPDSTPVEGATAYRSDWIGYQLNRVSYSASNSGYSWVKGSIINGGPVNETALGRPVADNELIVEDGVEYYVQEFQGGTIKVEKGDYFDETDWNWGEITYNDWGKARFDTMWDDWVPQPYF